MAIFFMDILTPAFKKKGPMQWHLTCCLLCALLCSCASAGIRKVEILSRHPPRNLPERILVKPFVFYEPALRVGRRGQDLEIFKYRLQQKVAASLAKTLSAEVAPAAPIAATAPLPSGKVWLITGRFDEVSQGSRLLREFIGFGAGATRLNASVLVWDLSSPRRPFLLVETTAGSRATPAVLGMATYVAGGIAALFSADSLFDGARSGLAFDSLRTGREAARAVGDYLHDQGGRDGAQSVSRRRARRARTWQIFGARQEGIIVVNPAAAEPR